MSRLSALKMIKRRAPMVGLPAEICAHSFGGTGITEYLRNGGDVELTVKLMLDQMAACLAGGGRIEIRGFASFSLRYRPARVGRNPKTGTPVSVPARYAPSFKPDKRLRERVNREAGGALEAQRHAGGSGDAYPCPLSARLPWSSVRASSPPVLPAVTNVGGVSGETLRRGSLIRRTSGLRRKA